MFFMGEIIFCEDSSVTTVAYSDVEGGVIVEEMFRPQTSTLLQLLCPRNCLNF